MYIHDYDTIINELERNEITELEILFMPGECNISQEERERFDIALLKNRSCTDILIYFSPDFEDFTKEEMDEGLEILQKIQQSEMPITFFSYKGFLNDLLTNSLVNFFAIKPIIQFYFRPYSGTSQQNRTLAAALINLTTMTNFSFCDDCDDEDPENFSPYVLYVALRHASLRHLTIETPIHNTQAVFIASNIQHLHYLNLCLSPKEFTQIEAKNFGDGIASGSLNELCLTLPATDKREEIIVTGERSRSVIRSCPSFTIDELAEALARHKNTSLQKLVLHQGYFQNKQATSLAQIIRHTVIQELQLGTNEDETDHESDQFIGNRGLSDLMDALAQNDTLTSFSFCCDKATESGFKLIAEAVEKNTTIKSLAVGTYLTIKREATFIAFAIAFLKNETLTSFNLDNCVENYPIPIHLADMIESQLELNKKIEGISSPTDSITYYNQLLQFRNEKQKVFDDYINSHAKSFLRHNYLSSERLRLLGNTQQLGAPANEIETTDALDKSPVFET